MTRVEFTQRICVLLQQMYDEGEQPILDYVKRSVEEQQRLFAAGKSQKDGVYKLSKHQSGTAADIYFVKGKNLVEPNKGHQYWHTIWCQMGGAPMIDWDCGHYEG